MFVGSSPKTKSKAEPKPETADGFSATASLKELERCRAALVRTQQNLEMQRTRYAQLVEAKDQLEERMLQMVVWALVGGSLFGLLLGYLHATED